MIEVIIYFVLLTLYLKLPLFENYRKSTSIRFNSLLILLSVALFIYSCVNIILYPDYIFSLNLENLSRRQGALLIWIVFFITVYGFTISHYYMKESAKKPGVDGDKGNRGLRGEIGDNKVCNPKECTKDICFKKTLEFCSKKYRKYVKKMYPEITYEPLFNNKFLMDKMRKLCKSDQIQKMFKKDGYGNTYRYINNNWEKWLNIILKYKNGIMFIENETLTDNDFDNLITKEDKLYSSFENLESPGTPSQGAETPFDELKKYDMWYWGESNALMPRVIYKCEINDKKDTLKKISSNHYKELWESSNARQAYIDRGNLVNGTCVRNKKYIPFLRKGSSDVSIYRPEILEYNDDLYYPLGDVLMEGKINDIEKTHVSKNDPKIQDKLKTKGPHDTTEIITGDIKHPVDFEPVFRSPRMRGEGIGLKGFSIWKPIPPPGYKCLGLVLDNTPNMIPPNADNIACVPEKCVRKYSNEKKKVWSNESEDRCFGNCGCDQETGEKDTDSTDNLELTKMMNHYFKNDDDLYELIPETEIDSCFDRAKERETGASKWKFNSKNDFKYSVYNIYNKK